jgi:hypothetical protein
MTTVNSAISSASQVSAAKKKEARQNIKFKRDKHREKVKGKFNFYEVPGGEMSFTFRTFKEDPIESFTMQDGEIYEVPLGVAIHLNTNCWYPEYEYLPGDGMQAAGAPVRGFSGHVQRITKKKFRCGFQSLEFLDIDELPQPNSSVVTIETVS